VLQIVPQPATSALPSPRFVQLALPRRSLSVFAWLSDAELGAKLERARIGGQQCSEQYHQVADAAAARAEIMRRVLRRLA